MGRRSGRAAARRAAAALESAPRGYEALDDEDEVMVDAPTSEPEHEPEAEPADEEDEEDKNHTEEEEEPEAENAEEEEEERQSAKEPTPPPVMLVRRKRLGRPPKNRPPDDDGYITVPIDQDTPRRRGRGGWRGRGGRKGGPLPARAEQAIDKEGTMAEIVNDECLLPEDPEGETKVDKLGNLSGGRDYRCRVFTVLGRGDRLYMLSTEPARCVGFRDSYLFFTKHLKLHKVIVDDDEKRDLIERDIIPHSYKGRSIGVVTARSVFREFGAKIIIGGRRINDDYRVADAIAEGAAEGEIADPTDIFKVGEPYNKNQYVAWHGASAVYHNKPDGAAVLPNIPGKPEIKKRRVNVNDMNWMLEHAREAGRFNAQLNAIRRQYLGGVYDVHTNQMHYPATMQPTQARIVQVQPSDEPDNVESEVFPPLPSRVARNFLVTDIYLETPPSGVASSAYEHSDPSDFLADFRGLGAVSDDIKSLLPEECRKAFDDALEQEKSWKARWGPEAEMARRREPIIDKSIVPYSMQ